MEEREDYSMSEMRDELDRCHGTGAYASGRQNPCKGREAGCTADCPEGKRCGNCRALHRQREHARQEERRAAGKCIRCGKRAATRDGQLLTLCPTHVLYFAERQRRCC